jgi:hypothetical protein
MQIYHQNKNLLTRTFRKMRENTPGKSGKEEDLALFLLVRALADTAYIFLPPPTILL